MSVAGFLEDLLDALGQRFVGPGSGDGGDGDQEQDGFDEFRFHDVVVLSVDEASASPRQTPVV